MVCFQGKKIRLRPIKKEDLTYSLDWRNDPEIWKNTLGFRFPVTEQMEERWYEKALSESGKSKVVFAIEELNTGNMIGLIHLDQLDWISKNCYFGIMIGDKRYHGQGIAAEGMRLLFTYAFDVLNLRKICLEVAAFNQAAMRLYHKFGFVQEGCLKSHIYFENTYHDIYLMRLFEHDFRTLQK